MNRKESFDVATAFASIIHIENPREKLNKEIDSTFYIPHPKDFHCRGWDNLARRLFLDTNCSCYYCKLKKIRKKEEKKKIRSASNWLVGKLSALKSRQENYNISLSLWDTLECKKKKSVTSLKEKWSVFNLWLKVLKDIIICLPWQFCSTKETVSQFLLKLSLLLCSSPPVSSLPHITPQYYLSLPQI